MFLIRTLFGLAVVAALIGVGIVIGVIAFDDDGDAEADTITERLQDLRQEMTGDIDNIVGRIGDNEDISQLRESLLERCGEEQEHLREGEGGTHAAETLGDICDEIRTAPDNAPEHWEDIEHRIEDLVP
jgi:hypothetical protein